MRYSCLIMLPILLLIQSAPCSADVAKPQAMLFIYKVPSRKQLAHNDTHALYEPEYGCYLGAFIDFDPTLHNPVPLPGRPIHQNPAAFEKKVGKPHAIYFFYMGYGQPLPYAWIRQLGEEGKFVHIALEPNDGLDKVRDDAYLRRLACQFRASGAHIFLRFASEMNGDWTPYHKDPELYRQKFRLVYRIMHHLAPNVALVWCPYFSPTRNMADYYPGDKYTDWVGVNIYSVPYHNNHLSEPAAEERPADLLSFFYRHYASRKPIMICEFGASHYSLCEKADRSRFAARKIGDMYEALPKLFPRVKAINYFDSNTLVFAPNQAYNDYCVTDSDSVLSAYRYLISSPYFLSSIPESSVAVPPIPEPLLNGERISGIVHFTCWASAPSDRLKVIYKVDGTVIYQAQTPDKWSCFWNASSVRAGKHLVTLEVFDQNGKLKAEQKRSVIIVRRN